MAEGYAFKSPRPFIRKRKKDRLEGFARMRDAYQSRCKDTEFTVDDIKERSNLFQYEFNQQELHDRVLVVKVMPDDYEMRELEARLEVFEEGKSEDERTKDFEVAESLKGAHSRSLCRTKRLKDRVEAKDHFANVKKPECEGARMTLPEMDEAGQTKSERGSFLGALEKDGFDETNVIRANAAKVHSYSIKAFENEHESEERAKVCNVNTVREAQSRCLNWLNGDKLYRVDSEEHFADVLSDNVGKGFEGCEEARMNVSELDEKRQNKSESGSDLDVEKHSDSDTKDIGLSAVEMHFNSIDGTVEKSNVREVVGEDSQSSSNSSDFISDGESYEEELLEKCGSAEKNYSVEKETGSVDAEASVVDVLREHRIYVHASWLAVNSRYFRSLLFESGMKECSSKEFCMKVTECEEKAFMIFIESIYNTDVLNDVDINTLLNVLRLSMKYDVKFSKLKAKRVLQATPLTLEVCETIIEAVNLGGLSDLDDVMENVENLLFREFEPLDETWEADKFSSLSKDTLQVLLSSNKLVVQSENTVFIALMQWIAKRSEVYGDLSQCSDLIKLVRFELIKPSYLHDVVRAHEVANQLDNFNEIYLEAITFHALPKKRRAKQGIPGQRHWCEATKPTYVWILDTDHEMFDFEDEDTVNSRKSSSFWYLGYKMHLKLDLSEMRTETRLFLVVENLSQDGSVELTYDVDVKFSDGLHKSYTSEPYVYRGGHPSRGVYPFDQKYSLNEIKEILFGGSVKVTIMFEISLEKLVDN